MWRSSRRSLSSAPTSRPERRPVYFQVIFSRQHRLQHSAPAVYLLLEGSSRHSVLCRACQQRVTWPSSSSRIAAKDSPRRGVAPLSTMILSTAKPHMCCIAAAVNKAARDCEAGKAASQNEDAAGLLLNNQPPSRSGPHIRCGLHSL